MTGSLSCCPTVTTDLVGAVASSVSALVALVALLYVGSQVRLAREQRSATVEANEAAERSVRGQFLLHLDEAFASHGAVHRNLMPGLGAWSDEAEGPAGHELPDVTAYMGLLERVMIMIDNRLLDADIVSRLYGYRVANICANRKVVASTLAETPDDWTDFLRLVRLLGGRAEHSLTKNWEEYPRWISDYEQRRGAGGR